MKPDISRRHFCIVAEKGDCHDWIPQGGHLLASGGFTRLPQTLQAVMAVLSGDSF